MEITLLILALLGATTSLYGEAAYNGYPDMIRMSEIIAVIEVTEVTPIETKGKHWTYREKIEAKVLDIIKGRPGKALTIYGLENFICAQCRFQKGKQLVFLKRDGDFLVGSNWHLSVRPITGDNLEWFQDSTSIQLISTPLSTVIKQIKTEIEKQKHPESCRGS